MTTGQSDRVHCTSSMHLQSILKSMTNHRTKTLRVKFGGLQSYQAREIRASIDTNKVCCNL